MQYLHEHDLLTKQLYSKSAALAEGALPSAPAQVANGLRGVEAPR